MLQADLFDCGGGHSSAFQLQMADHLLSVVLFGHDGLVHFADLSVDVVSVVSRHLDAVVVVLQGGVRHLESLSGNSGNTTEISLVTLVLQNRFLPKLNTVLLF